MEGRDDLNRLFEDAARSHDLREQVRLRCEAESIKRRLTEEEGPLIEELNSSPNEEAWTPSDDFWTELRASTSICGDIKQRVERGELSLDERGLAVDKMGRVYIPAKLQGLRDRLVKSCHDPLISAHRGLEASLKRLGRFTWAGIRSDVERKVKNCLSCARAKTRTGKLDGLMGEIGCPDRPFQHLHIDFTGPLDATHRILLIVDRLTG